MTGGILLRPNSILKFIIIIILLPHLVAAADTDLAGLDTAITGLDSFAANRPEYSLTGLMLKTIFALLLVVGIIYGVSKIMFRGRRIFSRQSSIIRQHYVYPLGTNKYLMIVEFAEKLLLLGVAENSINCLTEITDKDKINLLKLELSRGNTESFSALLNKETDRETGGNPAGPGAMPRSINRALLDRLRRLRGK